MVRTRGRDGRIRRTGGSSHGDFHQRQAEDQEHVQAQPAAVGWPGGPIDMTLLTRYDQHISRYTWLGQVTNCLFC